MKEHETEKFEKQGKFFQQELLITILGPSAILMIGIISNRNPIDYILISIPLTVGLIAALVAYVMFLGYMYSMLNAPFVSSTAQKVKDLPYHFSNSFKGRPGILYVDAENGMVAFISVFNPQKIQVFSAARIDGVESYNDKAKGPRFTFCIDGEKIVMPTLGPSRSYISPTGSIAAEALAKADFFAELLESAKRQAEAGIG